MKIGILGGTFNPIHKGHIALARQVKKKLQLDKIIFVPAYLPPHKSKAGIICAQDRLRMVELATKGIKGFSVSDLEIRRRGRSYSVDTLKDFKNKFKGAELYFIVGTDSLKELNTWKDLDEIFALSHFVLVNRPGFKWENLPFGALAVKIKPQDISSTQIRKLIRQDRSINKLVTPCVAEYILKKRLYQ